MPVYLMELFDGQGFGRFRYDTETGELQPTKNEAVVLNQYLQTEIPDLPMVGEIEPTSSVYDKWVALYQTVILPHCQLLESKTTNIKVQREQMGMNIVNTLLSQVVWSALMGEGDPNKKLQEVYRRIGLLLWNSTIQVPTLHFNENIRELDQMLNFQANDDDALDKIVAVHTILEFFGNIEVRRQVFPILLPSSSTA